MPAGLAFREGKQGDNFSNLSPFLLHVIKKEPKVGAYQFEMNA